MILSFEYFIKLRKFDKDTMEFVLNKNSVVDLKKMLKSEKVKGYYKMNKAAICSYILNIVKKMLCEFNSIKTELLALPDPHDTDRLKSKFRKWSKEKYYFTGIWDKNNLKKKYRELCKILHPDKFGTEESFRQMREEYNFRIKTCGMTCDEYINKYEGTEEGLELLKYSMMNTSLSVELAQHQIEVETIKYGERNPWKTKTKNWRK